MDNPQEIKVLGSFSYDPPARSLDRGMGLGSEDGASSLGKTSSETST
jgi:hypothetical protein